MIAETERPATGLVDVVGVREPAFTNGHVTFGVDSHHLDEAMRQLSVFGIRSLVAHPPTLEELFLREYGDEVEAAP